MGDQTGPAKGWLVDVARTGTEVSIVVFIGVFFFFGLLGSPFRFTKTFTHCGCFPLRLLPAAAASRCGCFPLPWVSAV
jgi:hypothetical protein